MIYIGLHDNNYTIDDNDIPLADVREKVLPSSEQRYSPFHNNDFRDNNDPTNDIRTQKWIIFVWNV